MDQVAGLGVGDGFRQVAAGQDDVLELAVIAVRLFHAIGHQVGDDHGVEAQAALGAVVGRAERLQQVFEQRLRQVVRGREDHRLGAIFLLDVQHVLGDDIQGFVPGRLRNLPSPRLPTRMSGVSTRSGS